MRKKILYPICICLVLTAFSMGFAQDTPPQYLVFMHIDGFTGDSTDPHHTGWIDLYGYNVILQDKTTRITKFTIVKAVDKASHKLFLDCLIGRSIGDVQISICPKNNTSRTFFYYRLKTAKVDMVRVEYDPKFQTQVEKITFDFGHYISGCYTTGDDGRRRAISTPMMTRTR